MVKLRKSFLIAACFVLISGLYVSHVNADDWNKATIITTNQPIEVPGRILPAGKYMFRLMDSIQDRHIVQILSSDETHLYQTVLGIPDYRQQATDNAQITFYETPNGGVSPVREWFYAGERSGIEFIYPKQRGALLAAVTSQNVPTSETAVTAPAVTNEETAPAPLAPEANNAEPAPVVADQSLAAEPDEVSEVAQNTPPAAPEATSPAPPQPQSDTTTTPEALPKTASPDDLLLLIGLGSAFAAYGIRRFRS